MTKTEKRHNWLPSKRRRHDQRSDQSFAKIYGTRLFLDSRIVDHGPKTNPWEIRVWGGHRGWLKTNKLSHPSKDKSSQKAGKSSSSSDLASRWILMPRSKTFYLMPKNVAMESNMTSTDQLMENSLKLFKMTRPEVGGDGTFHSSWELARQNKQISAARKLWSFNEISS